MPSSPSNKKFRLVTRSDFDGLVCAVILKDIGLIDDILFVHPKDMQDGKIEITDRDITTNLPYVEAANLVFDHHESETIRAKGNLSGNHIIDKDAPSAARVVYEYYGGAEKLPNISTEMMDAVDKGDSAQFSREEILKSKDWVILNFLMDARTGLGRFREFRISNYQLMMKLIDCCKDQTIQQILEDPDVAERLELYNSHHNQFVEQINRCSTVHDNLVILDLRNEDIIYCGNRFMIYALYPQCNISIHILWGFKQQNIVYAIGKSILDRSSKTNVGELALKYEGGGHNAAGTCQVPHETALQVLNELTEKITLDG
jgi:nanoRNase/pAp phosphatase (c-di-AMP/oligoRNAs hydrolase)